MVRFHVVPTDIPQVEHEDLQMIANQQATPGKGVMSKATPPGSSVRSITPAGVALYKTLRNPDLPKMVGFSIVNLR